MKVKIKITPRIIFRSGSTFIMLITLCAANAATNQQLTSSRLSCNRSFSFQATVREWPWTFTQGHFKAVMGKTRFQICQNKTRFTCAMVT